MAAYSRGTKRELSVLPSPSNDFKADLVSSSGGWQSVQLEKAVVVAHGVSGFGIGRHGCHITMLN